MGGAVFILNPAAGHGRAEKTWKKFQRELRRALPGAELLRTERRGHAADLAYDAARFGAEKIVAVGGDGTFCEALQGVMRLPREKRLACALGLVPAGSGCDLARHLGCPRGPDALAALLASGGRRAADAGLARYRAPDGLAAEKYFINMASFGLAGDVAHHVHRMGKALGGTLSYALSSAWTLFGARAKAVRLSADGEDLSGRYYLGVLANTSSIGGGMLVAPGADEGDGLMDLVLVADMPRRRLWRNFPRLYGGTHLREPGISLRRVKTLKAESGEKVWLNIDGEAEGELPAVFETLPGAVTLIAPAGS